MNNLAEVYLDQGLEETMQGALLYYITYICFVTL